MSAAHRRRAAAARRQLIEVLPKLAAEPMPVTLLYQQRRNLPRRVRASADWVAELLARSLIQQYATPAYAELLQAPKHQG